MEDADNSRVRSRMDSRAGLSRAQMRTDDIKSDICDKIRERRVAAGLSEKIRALESFDKALYDYIVSLERVNVGLWCTRCDGMKTIGVETDGKPVPAHTQGLMSKVATIEHEYRAIADELRAKYAEMEQKINNVVREAYAADNFSPARAENEKEEEEEIPAYTAGSIFDIPETTISAFDLIGN